MYMKFIIVSLVVNLLLPSIVSAESRVLINQKDLRKCSVEIEENYFFGILAAKLQIEKINFINFDSFTFIDSTGDEDTCIFLFNLFSDKEFLGGAEIELSKPDWQKISRRIVKGSDTVHW